MTTAHELVRSEGFCRWRFVLAAFLIITLLPEFVGAAAPVKIPSHREVQCPTAVAPIMAARHSMQEYRQDLKNLADEPAVVSWWSPSGKEIFVTAIPPNAELRLKTFLGDRFIIRSSTDADVILLDLTVGVHHIGLPAGMTCDPVKSAISNPRKPNPPGELTPASTVRGWVSDSPCDLIGSWVVFNDTGVDCREIGERWMVDMTSSNKAEAGHFEVTYLTHLFRFAMTDKTVVRDFLVSPTNIPNCRTAAAPALATTATTLQYLHPEDVHAANATVTTCDNNSSVPNNSPGDFFSATMNPSSIVFQHPRDKAL